MPINPNQINLVAVPNYTKQEYETTIDILKDIIIKQTANVNGTIKLINDIKYLYNYKQLHHFTKTVIQNRQHMTKHHYPKDKLAKAQIQIQMFSNRYSHMIFNYPKHTKIINRIKNKIQQLNQLNMIRGGTHNFGTEHDAYIKMYMLIYWIIASKNWGVRELNPLMYRLERRARLKLNHWYLKCNGQIRPEIKTICDQIDATKKRTPFSVLTHYFSIIKYV